MNSRQEIIRKLHELYNLEISEIEFLTLEELEKILKQEEEKQIFLNKNPNKFFYIKSLPLPKEVKKINSNKPGWIIFSVFVLLLFLIFVLFMILAFR
ncbi:hypothetical protein [Mycoplasmopsis cricetuli]|uniref:hypothetical protein n=1 Tax=Mycoplasmopsis cricetuli TaxID=171283 RepID=UPI00046F005F|nr:hypothetical protein [Mycoplasmopsis cricetuli]